MLYVDTSVIVSALTNETDTALSQIWLAGQETSELTISDWTTAEFASALSIKLRTGALGADHRAAALSTFTRLCAESLRTLPVERKDFRAAARFADQSELNLRAGDALHLAICANHGASLCTLDRRLAEAAPRLGVPVRDVTLSKEAQRFRAPIFASPTKPLRPAQACRRCADRPRSARSCD